MKRTRIALFGIFGIQNLGNECTLQAMIHNLRERLPGAELLGVSYEPEDTWRRHGIEATQICSPWQDRFAALTERTKTGVLKLLRIVLLRVPVELLDWVRVIRTLRRTDMLVMTGTGMLTDYSTSPLGYPYEIFKWTIGARLAGCKVRFVGIGTGPIYHPLSRAFIKAALGAADYKSFRDGWSKNRLEELGIDPGKEPVRPDLAFSLPEQLFGHDNSSSGARRCIGLGVVNYFDWRASGRDSQLKLRDTSLRKMCRLVRLLIERGYSIRILHGDMLHDGCVRRELRERLEKEGIRYEAAGITDPDICSVEELVAELDQTDLVIAPRFHNLLLALLSNKPVISLSYDPKNDYLLQGFGMDEYCQDIDDIDVDKLMDQLANLEASFPRLRPGLLQQIQAYRQELDRQYDFLVAGLRRGGANVLAGEGA